MPTLELWGARMRSDEFLLRKPFMRPRDDALQIKFRPFVYASHVSLAQVAQTMNFNASLAYET